MKKYLFALATLAIAVVACNKETDVQQPDKAGKRMITVIAETPETRTVLDDQHNALLWAPGDNFRLMTNTGDSDANHDAQTLTYVENGRFEVEVSADADEAYAYYFAGDYTDANHSTPTAYTAYIERKQTQTKAGVLNGQMLPMAAKGPINADNTVSLSFHQMAGVLALNIYSTTKVAGEVINSVTVTPIGNTKFCGAMYGTNLTANNVLYTNGGNEGYSSVTVALGEPYDYVSAKPDDKKMFDKQIYVVLGKQSYSSVKFEITTNLGTYVITSSGSPLNLADNDFYPVNINLEKAEFEETEPDYVTLPWEWTGSSSQGKAELVNNNYGVSQNGLGSDYAASNAPYRLKFDGVGDYILIKTDKAIGSVTIGTKAFGSAASTFKIQGSSNGSNFSDVESFTTSATQNTIESFTTSQPFDESYRYVKIIMSNKGGNIGMGQIKITSGVIEPTIDNITIADAIAIGGEGLTAEVALSNYTEAPTLVAVADGNVVTTATVSSVSTSTAIVTYTLAPNYSGEAKSGSITIKDANNVSGRITVNQAADVFTISTTTIDLTANAGATKTLKVTSDYAWTIVDDLIDGFTVTPMNGEGSAEAITLTVKAAANNPTANVVELGVFAIKRTVDGKESATITVSQKSAKLATPNLSVSGDASAKTITVSWNPNNIVTKYRYYVLDSELEYKVPVTTTEDNTTTSFTIQNITLGETYSISVIAVGNNDPWIDSDEANEEFTVEAGSLTAEVTIEDYATSNNWVNAEQYLSINLNSEITVTASGGENLNNTGKYYTADHTWRFYANENAKLTINAGERTIQSVTLTYTTKDNGTVLKSGTKITSGSTIDVNASSVVFDISQSSGNKGKVFVSGISVTYK